MSKWPEQRPTNDYYQILAPDGTTKREPPDFDEDELRWILQTFIRTRAFDEKTMQLQRGGEINITSTSLGEEATPLGSAAALEPGDWVFPSYRQQAAFLYWDTDVARLVAKRMGVSQEDLVRHLGNAKETKVNFTHAYVPLATNVMNATGFSMSKAAEDNNVVTLTYIGDGSTSQGDFYEALNFAGVFEVPLITIIQNNQWAISVPSTRQTAAETFAQKGKAVGIPYERVDGNDIFAIYKKTKDAVESAREGGGPKLIECVTYRRASHNTADEAEVYRREKEVEYWKELDPLNRYETYLKNEGILTEKEIEEIRDVIQEEIDEAIRKARQIPLTTNPMDMFENHLHGVSWNEWHQRQELRAELEGYNPFTDFDGRGLE